MSGDSTAVSYPTRRQPDKATNPDPQAVFEALADPDCRAILRAVGSTAMTANECSDACDLPLSTAYRKLEMLTEAGLVAEHLRIRRDGKHANQYRRRVEGVRVDVHREGRLEVDVETGEGHEVADGPPAPSM